MSCKKRCRPSPIVDSTEADLDDAALRKELCKKKQVKAKTAFSNGACLKALTQTSAPSVAVVTLFSAMALNYYKKNGPSLSEAAQSCLDIQYGHPSPPPPPTLSSRCTAPYKAEANHWARRAWLSEVQGGSFPGGSEAEIKHAFKIMQQKHRRQKTAAEQVHKALSL